MPTNTWIAAAPGLASDPANWSLGRAPLDGDDIIFSAVSANNCSWDLVGKSLASFDMAAYPAAGIVNLTNGFSCTSLNGSSEGGYIEGGATIVCSGNAAAPRPNTVRYTLEMTGNGTTVRNYGNAINRLRVNAQVSTAGEVKAYYYTILPGMELNISAGHSLQCFIYSGGWDNQGAVNGSGTMIFYPRYADTRNLALGVFNANVEIRGYSAATVDNSITLAANTHIGGNLSIYSDSAYLTSLLHGSNYTLEVDGLTTLGVRGVMTQGTGQWTFTGGFTQNGASSVFNQGGNVITSNLSVTNGVFLGVVGYSVTASGVVTIYNGALTSNNVSLILTGEGVTHNINQGGYWNRSITFSASCTMNGGSCNSQYGIIIGSGVTVTLGTGAYLYLTDPTKLTNNGIITGDGEFRVRMAAIADKSFIPGVMTVSCVKLICSSAAVQDVSLIISTNCTLGPVRIYGEATTYKITVTLNGATINTPSMSVEAYAVLTGSGTINGSVTVSAGLLTQTGDIEIMGLLSITGGTITGDTVHKFILHAGYSRTSGTNTHSSCLFEFAESCTLYDYAYSWYRLFKVRAGVKVTVNGNIGCYGTTSSKVVIEAGAELYIKTYRNFSDYYFHNAEIAGRITGPGTYIYNLSGGGTVRGIPVVTGSIEVATFTISQDSGSKALTLDRDFNTLSNVKVGGSGGTLTLDLNGHELSCLDFRTIYSLAIVNGNGGKIRYAGSWDTSLGEWNPQGCEVIKTGSGTEKLGAGQSFYDFEALHEPLNLASDVRITHIYRHARAAVLNGYKLTLDRADLEEDLFKEKSALRGKSSSASQLTGQIGGN